ncbi:ModD protein [Morganella morganii]|uniref:Putative pyrophosphorylase ModD n=1 Tax=Morganella morganii TaxID=582 RepID=A0AAI9HQT5_MORMO|nr:ModD protein [Morganella morganii]
MIYYSDAFLDSLLLEDIHYGDLTTRALGIGAQSGEMHFSRKQAGYVSGLTLGQKLLEKLGLQTQLHTNDGDHTEAGALLLTATGRADALHQGWKIVQNVIEWSSGVTQMTRCMVDTLRQYQPDAQLACTRKNIPGTKLLATAAVLAGKGIIHRQGCAETILLFANHRRFLAEPENWCAAIAALRREAPEKTIIAEADNPDEAYQALKGCPDVLQLDKFSPDDIRRLVKDAAVLAPGCTLSVAGGLNAETIGQYADTGVKLFVTSAPYYASPADIKVRLYPR